MAQVDQSSQVSTQNSSDQSATNGRSVSEYDRYNYDYKQYWEGREYENLAEDLALGKLFKKMSGRRIVDVGGSFGRLLPIYYDKYEEPVIIDYSLKTLLRYEKAILDRYPNTKLVAANVYHLPFVGGSFDAALMVRVLHHISEPETYYEELSKILDNNAIYIQEFANKIHLKARVKWILSGKFEMLDSTPYQQPSQGNFEGVNSGQNDTSIFLNFHPKHVREMLAEAGFKVVGKGSSSFIRIPKLKASLSLSTIMKLEKAAQFLLDDTNIAPSIFYKTVVAKSETKSETASQFREILVCPECKGKLNFNEDSCRCTKCGREYKKHSTVWDFRIS